MITKYKRENIGELINNEDFNQPYNFLIADKLRAVYVLFGWTHMTKDFSEVYDHVDNLTMSIYNKLNSGEKESSTESAGFKIEGWFDEEGYLNLDYYFDLG